MRNGYRIKKTLGALGRKRNIRVTMFERKEKSLSVVSTSFKTVYILFLKFQLLILFLTKTIRLLIDKVKIKKSL